MFCFDRNIKGLKRSSIFMNKDIGIFFGFWFFGLFDLVIEIVFYNVVRVGCKFIIFWFN